MFGIGFPILFVLCLPNLYNTELVLAYIFLSMKAWLVHVTQQGSENIAGTELATMEHSASVGFSLCGLFLL